MNRTQDALTALEHVQRAFAKDGWHPTLAAYESIERFYTKEYAKRQAAEAVSLQAVRDRDSWKYTAIGLGTVIVLVALATAWAWS
jgi:hypothetical protein